MPIATEKLQKRLASSGLGSRRDMEDAISAGRVTVNNRIATLGDRVSADDDIMLDGRPLPAAAATAAPRVLMYNKPESEICTMSDPEGRRTVFQSLPAVRSGRWIAVGRLDINTTGLLIFTTDGALANALMHPSSNIDREYLCRVRGDVDDDMLKRLRDGVLLEDGLAKFTSIASGGSSEASNHWFYVTLEEGRNREVRRLWESQGAQVSRLKRVRYGALTMPSRLKMGQWMEMDPLQVAALYQMAGLKIPATIGALTPQQQHDRKRQDRQSHSRQNTSAKPDVQKFRTKSATARFSERSNRGDERSGNERNSNERNNSAAKPRRDGLQWLDKLGDEPAAKSRPPKTGERSAPKISGDRPARSATPSRGARPERDSTADRPMRHEGSARAERSTRDTSFAGRSSPAKSSPRPARTESRSTRTDDRSDSRSSRNDSRSAAGESRTPRTDRAIREAKAGGVKSSRDASKTSRDARVSRSDSRADSSSRSTASGYAAKPRSDRAADARGSREKGPARAAAKQENRGRRDETKSSTAPSSSTRPHRSTTRVLGASKPANSSPRRK